MILTLKWRKLSCAVIAAAVLFSSPPWSANLNVAYAEPGVTLKSQEILTSGAVLKKYEWQSTRSGKAYKTNANVVEVDLTNPYVKLDVMTGIGNQFTKKQTVLGMATETKAVAGVNGDFYNTQAEGVPEGPQISNGQLMATPPFMAGMYSFAIDKNNKPIVDAFVFQGKIITKDQASYTLGGINKTYYWYDDGTHSHIDGLFMYTNAWGQIDRSNDGVTYPTEVLVQNNVITQIADNGIIQMIAPKDGYILRAAGKAADFVRAHMKVGDPLIADYKISSADPSKNYDVSTFKMMIGANTLLVDEGQPSVFTRDVNDLCCYRSRTALGYSQDQKTAYVITVDNSGDSKGLSMTELQQFMVQVGVWKGMNLDGGGSTQMAVRPLGEFNPVLANKTETGIQRKVVNGVGVYSTAPPGEVKQLFIQAPEALFVGEQAALKFKAYDIYYNPLVTDNVAALWSVAGDMGSFQGNVFTPSKVGMAKVTAASGQGSHTAEIEVIGRNQLKSIQIQADNVALTEGETYRIPVMATTLSGKTREIPPALVQWEVLGIQGEVTNGQLTVKSLAGSQGAQLIARYDGFSAIASIPVGVDKVWYDLDTYAVMTLPDAKPTGVASSVNIQTGENNNKFLELKYDFSGTQEKGNRWAYAMLDTRILIDGEPQYLKVKVNGDESLNWLRAELVDNAGKSHYVDLSRNVNWKGWRLLTADLTEFKMAYPIRVKSVYLVNEEIGRDEKTAKGSIGIDDITFTYKGSMAAPSNNAVKLTIGKKEVAVNGKTSTLEQAPVIVEGNTLIPIRFVTDALGGTVRWDDKERKVTVLRGDKLIELWIDQKGLIVNGQRVTAEVAPVIMNNLTVVPLRILSENLGWKVTWDEKTRQITLQ